MSNDSSSRRPRISLLTLLLLVTISALGFGIWRLNRELVPLRQEVREYRDRLGILKIEEPEKIHAVRLRQEERYSIEPLVYQFRVHLPEDRKYFINHTAFDIPLDGMPNPAPKPYSYNIVASGESLITVLIERRIDQKTGKPQPRINVALNIESKEEDLQPLKANGSIATSGSSIGVSEAKNDWIVNKKTGAMCFTKEMIGRTVEQFSADETVVLLRLKAGKVARYKETPGGGRSWGTSKIQEPSDGFMLWIEPEQK